MIPSMLDQVIAAARPAPSYRANPKRERKENILMLMIDRNVCAAALGRHYKKSSATLQEDLSELADEGYAFSFMSTVGGGRRRLYSLTKSGLIRAKQLKEMSE